MSMAIITYRPIGVIRSGHAHPEETPIQPLYAKGCQGRAEIFPEYADGLRDLEGFSPVYLLYHYPSFRAYETDREAFFAGCRERGVRYACTLSAEPHRVEHC